MILLWVFLPVCAYALIPVVAMFVTFFTPRSVHRCPICAAWAIFFAAGMAWMITEKSMRAVAFVLVMGTAWHCAKYWLLFQLTYDPILKLVVQDRQEYIEELKTEFYAVAPWQIDRK